MGDWDAHDVADFTDQVRWCFDCHDQFVWAAGEQRFYADREFTAAVRGVSPRTRVGMVRAGGQCNRAACGPRAVLIFQITNSPMTRAIKSRANATSSASLVRI